MEIKDKVTDLIRNNRTRLPTLPVVINNIILIARSEKTSAIDLGDFIINDQAISARVLKVANSAYYGMSKKIDSISRAVVVLGFKEIISLALGMGVFSALSQKEKDVRIDMSELWQHTIGVGFAARDIVKKTGMMVNETMFLVGLLHDIGKIIFSIYFPDEYREVLEKTVHRQVPLYHTEKEILGLDHAEMAYLLMKQWNFSADIIQPVRYHHDPSACPEAYLYMAMVINVANFICHQSGIGQSGNKNIQQDNEVLEKLGLSDQDMVTLAETLESERSQVEDFLEVLS
jgi:putative nucleotidyltransferase with HDIG domain